MTVSSSGWAPIQRIRLPEPVESPVECTARCRGDAACTCVGVSSASRTKDVRKRVIASIYVACVVIVGCQQRESAAPAAEIAQTATEPQDLSTVALDTRIPVTPPTFLDRCALGSALASDGTVQESKQVFAPGEPIHMTMWITESPGGLNLASQWFDSKETMIAEELKAMNGGKVATFTLAPKKRLAPGTYVVKGWWGGNEACGYEFKVEGPPAKKKASKKKT